MMRKLLPLLAILFALLAPAARAQYAPIPNYSGVGAGQNFRNDINNHFSGLSPIAPRLVALQLSVLLLTPEQDGQVYLCTNCAQSAVCGTTGQGALAVGFGGQWTCVNGPNLISGPPTGLATGDLAGSYPAPTVNHVLNGQTPVTTLNGLNALAPATANYGMGTHKITGLATDQATGDALSRGNSSLSALAPPIVSFPMGGQTFQSVAAAQASGQPVVAGVTNTAANTQLSLNGSLNVKAQFGAKGDTRTGTDGVTNATTTFTSATANFTTADVGKAIAINGANGFPAGTTIASYISATTVTTSAAATGSASGLTWWVGTNDGAAILAAAVAGCGVLANGAYFCTNPVYLPPGQYYVRNLVLNPSTIGGGTAVIGQHFICAGANGRGFTGTIPPAPPLTTILVDDNGGSVGIDMFANASALIDNCDIRTLTTSTGPKALLAYGKTSTCDCDVVTLRNTSVETYSTTNIGAVFSLGGEDTDIDTSQIVAYNGGHAVVFSAQNAVGGGITGTGVSLFQPNTTNVISPSFPVSMLHSNVRSSLLYTNGGTLSTSAPAAGLYLDTPTSGTYVGSDGIMDSDVQLTGYNDIGVWDGQQGSANGTILALASRHNVFECLNAAGNGHCQSIKIGNNLTRADLTVEHNAAAQLSRTGTDGVTTTSSATFTSATANFTSADVGSLITIPGANGIAAGAYIQSVTNNTTVTLSVTATTGGTGLSWTISVPPMQFYNGLTISDIGLSTSLGSGPSLACKNGVGSRIYASGSLAAQSCPGATLFPDASAAQVVQQASNGTVGMQMRPFQDYGTRSGYDLQCTNATGSQTLCGIDANGNGNFNSWEAIKLAGAPTAIGANYCQMFVVAGTNAGSCKLQAICGTSATPVTITDNIGAGC